MKRIALMVVFATLSAVLMQGCEEEYKYQGLFCSEWRSYRLADNSDEGVLLRFDSKDSICQYSIVVKYNERDIIGTAHSTAYHTQGDSIFFDDMVIGDVYKYIMKGGLYNASSMMIDCEEWWGEYHLEDYRTIFLRVTE